MSIRDDNPDGPDSYIIFDLFGGHSSDVFGMQLSLTVLIVIGTMMLIRGVVRGCLHDPSDLGLSVGP